MTRNNLSLIHIFRSAMVAAMKAGDKERKAALSFLLSSLKNKAIDKRADHFSHASETPGLGAEIASTHFQGEFPGKKTLENGEVVLGVVKNGKVEKPDYQVDGISGGTITSVGVDAMLKTCLNSYKNFLTNNNEEK